jgi:signal transduction histidine kinase
VSLNSEVTEIAGELDRLRVRMFVSICATLSLGLLGVSAVLLNAPVVHGNIILSLTVALSLSVAWLGWVVNRTRTVPVWGPWVPLGLTFPLLTFAIYFNANYPLSFLGVAILLSYLLVPVAHARRYSLALLLVACLPLLRHDVDMAMLQRLLIAGVLVLVVMDQLQGGVRSIFAYLGSVRDKTEHLLPLVLEEVQEKHRALEMAQSASQAKAAFLAHMSQELREPLNAILGFSQHMVHDERVPENLRHDIDIIIRTGNHLLSVANDVLKISRLEAGRIAVVNDPFDLRALLSAIEDKFRLRAESKDLAFVAERPAELPNTCLGDAQCLRKVLTNLLDNAVKFTDRGQIRLRVTELPYQRMLFEVSDSGPGIVAKDRERIFLPFYQSELAAKNGDGAGLGLTISRELVHLMGGELRVESTPGEGSTFSFSIPLPSSKR